jgi:hypothetical protein
VGQIEAVMAVNIEIMLLWDLMAFSVADTTSIPEAGIWQTIWCHFSADCNLIA